MRKEASPKQPGFEQRFYRTWAAGRGLCGFEVIVAETDLQVFADRPLERETDSAVRRTRRDIELYAAQHDGFLESLTPLVPDIEAPEVVRRMCEATAYYGVGPMASVAGVVAEFVGRDLLEHSSQVIIENGGDIFFDTEEPPVFGLYAGPASAFSGRVKFRPSDIARGGMCTSSGTVGHSLSFGRADAVAVLAGDATLADAAATAICNSIRTEADVEKAIEIEQERGLVDGLVIAIGKTLGVWGRVEIIEGA
jgi:hypothetical protein